MSLGNPALSKWRASLNYISDAPLLGDPSTLRNRTPTSECGVSLAWLQYILRSLSKSGLDVETCGDFVTEVVIPLTRFSNGQRHRLWNLIPAEHVGKPQHYIIHAWSDPLETIVDALMTHLTPIAQPGMPQPKGPSPEVMRDTYIWLDVVSQSQHHNALIAQTGPDLAETRAAVSAASEGAIAVVAPGSKLLTRVWCLYECWAAVYYGSPNRLRVLFPHEVSLSDLAQFQDMATSIDLLRCEATRPLDKQKIISELKHAAGLKRAHSLLPDALMRSMRAGLRWASSLRSTILYCAMALRSGELAQVQTVLHSIPEIHDDEKMLQDIRNLFKVYDTDGSGELDEDEFVEVLTVAGFTAEEGHDMFGQVDVDGGGSVSLEEFEAWWIESQRQQSTRYGHKVELTVEALAATLKQLLQLLERQGLSEFSDYFKGWMAKLSRARPKHALANSPVRGEWQPVAEQCAWHVNAHNYRAAAKLMWDLLTWNADTCSVNPVEKFKHPDKVLDKIDSLEALCDMFEDFGRLLQRVPATQRQAEYFLRAARDLRDGELLDLMEAEMEAEMNGEEAGAKASGDGTKPKKRARKKSKKQLEKEKQKAKEKEQERELQRERNRLRALEEGDSAAPGALMRIRSRRSSVALRDPEAGAAEFIRRRTKGKKRSTKLFPGKYDMQREAIVTDMVRLKYGSSTLLSNNLIVEAEKSLSEWMAAQKAAVGKGTKGDNREAVNEFGRQYLVGGASPNALGSLPDIGKRWGGGAAGGSSGQAGAGGDVPPPDLPGGLGALGMHSSSRQTPQRSASEPANMVHKSVGGLPAIKQASKSADAGAGRRNMSESGRPPRKW